MSAVDAGSIRAATFIYHQAVSCWYSGGRQKSVRFYLTPDTKKPDREWSGSLALKRKFWLCIHNNTACCTYTVWTSNLFTGVAPFPFESRNKGSFDTLKCCSFIMQVLAAVLTSRLQAFPDPHPGSFYDRLA
jgi:hypothetical protein